MVPCGSALLRSTPQCIIQVLSRNFRQLMRGEQLVEHLTDQPAHRRVLVEGEEFQLLAHLGGARNISSGGWRSTIPSRGDDGGGDLQ